jgi:DNA-binding winged helix-turn-helix (wHTH) protein/Tol biopolymer transport system component
MVPPEGYTFGDFSLDLRRMSVRRNGETLPLEPKAFDVLCHLIAHRDRLVGKDELLDVIWPGTFVTPNALTRAVAQLRKVLGDDAAHPQLIETVARRGYRFIAEVAEVDGGRGVSGVAEGAGDREGRQGGLRTVPPPRSLALARDDNRGASREPRLLVVVVLAALLVAVAAWSVWRFRGRFSAGSRQALQVEPLTAYGDVTDAVISPDGRTVAYVRSSGGRQGLWLRQIAGNNPIELVPAAEVGYYGLTFAPDSGSIYYVVRGPAPLADPGGMLFQIPALGGAPRRLGTAFNNTVAVSPDGRRLASLRPGPAPGESSLLVAGSDGSGAQPLLTRREPESLAPGFFIAPSWSPSGDRIAAVVRRTDRPGAWLVTVDAKSGATREFSSRFMRATFTSWLPDDSGIVVVGTGRENYSSPSLRGAQLWLQPLPDGPPRPITADTLEWRVASASADASQLVGVATAFQAALWLTPMKEAGERGGTARKIPSSRDDGYFGLAWLGPGELVFTSAAASGMVQIWSMRADGTNRRQLTTEGWNVFPRPTRDGETIYFGSTSHGGRGLWRMRRDGTDARRLAVVPYFQDLLLTLDEQWLIYSTSSGEIASTWKVPAGGGQPTLLVRGLSHPAVSPDGRWIAGMWQEALGVRPSLAVFPLGDATRPRTFPAALSMNTEGGVWWSGDGASVLYTSAERSNIWRQRLAGGPPEPVTDFAEGVIARGDLSPDGRTLLTTRGNLSRDAYRITGFR